MKKKTKQLKAAVEPETETKIELCGAVGGRGLTVQKFDEESIWLQLDDGEGMQLRITKQWWSDNF